MSRNSAAYDEDFYAWTQAQAQEIRRAGAERLNAPIDWENVAEEIESMGRSESRSTAGSRCWSRICSNGCIVLNCWDIAQGRGGSRSMSNARC